MEFTDYHTRLAAYALLIDGSDEVDGQQRVLLTWWNGEGHSDPQWSLPGGGIEFDEAVLDGLVREVFEETGHHIEPGPLLVEDFFTGRGRTFDGWFRSQRFVFDATITGGVLGTTEVDGSTDLAAWVPLSDLEGQPRADIVDVALAAHAARRAGESRP